MKKKIVISENQYKRVFLGEQDPKNKSLAAKAAPPRAVARVSLGGALWLDKPLPIDDLFSYHIKNKTDGDNFRKWVRSDSKRLTKVNSEYKKKGLTGTLDSSGSYNNEHMKVAWRIVGDEYLKSNKGKGWEGVDDYAGLDVQHPLYSQQSKEVVVKVPKLSNYFEYQNFKNALINWDKNSSYFGWTYDRTINSDRISDIVSGKVEKSTCINPTYILQKMNELKSDMIWAAIKNGANYEKAQSILDRRGFDDYVSNYFDEISVGMKPVKPQPIVDKTYTGGPRDENNFNTQVLDPSGGLGGAYNQNLANIQQFNNLNQIKYEDDLSDYKRRLELYNELNELGEEFKENLKTYNKYDKVLDLINQQNVIISLQTKDRYENACVSPVYVTKVLSVGYGAPGSGGQSPTVDETFEWSDACKNNGGVFMIPTTPIDKSAGKESIGFIGNKTICCCVNPTGTANVKVNGVNNDYYVDIDIQEWCGKSIGDIRSTWKKVEDWTTDCVTDWHCIADIASIVAIAFGPMGILVSGLIDLVSAIGYVAEGEEGWELNAGLTAIGALGGLGEAIKLANKGPKFASKLGELGKIVDGAGNDLIKLEKDIVDWSKTLNPDELKVFDDFTDVSKKLNTPEYQKLIKDLESQSKNLDVTQKGVLSNIFKNEEPKKIQQLFDESGQDLSKMINKYNKGVKQFIIQGGLFAGMYVYSEEIGEGLLNLCKNFNVDLLGVFDDECNPINDGGLPKPSDVDFSDILINDPEYAKELKEKIDLLTPKSGFDFNQLNFGEELKKYRDSLLKIENLGDNYLPLEQKIIDLHKKIIEVTDGYGMDITQINNKLSVAIDIYNKIVSLTGNENLDDIKKLIDVGIYKLESIKGVKISDKKKKAISQTGNPNIDDDDVDIWDEMIKDLESKEKMENKEEKEKLDEQIKRIKSLFGNDRLYGNLISEQTYATDTDGDGKINEPEAKSFLNSLGYITKTSSDDDLCLSPNSDLKKVYDIVKSKTNVGFQMNPNTEIGCALTIYSRDKASSRILNQITLFEGATGNRFGMIIKVKDVDCCDKDINSVNNTIPSGSAVWNVGVNGYLDVGGVKKFGLGLTYIKVDGTWKIDNTTGLPRIDDGIVVKLLNEQQKGVKTKITFLGFDVPVTGFSNTGTERGGEKEWMTDGGGSCQSLNDFVGSILGGSIDDEFNLEQLINNKM